MKLCPYLQISFNISDDGFDPRLGLFETMYHIDAGTPILMAAANRCAYAARE
jgi:hypothetical protein